MNPEVHKLVLLYVAMGLGVFITLAGVTLFFLGATAGASGVEISIGKLKIKISKAGPGAIVTLLGVFLLSLSLFFAPSKKTEVTTTETNNLQILEDWLANANKITSSENYLEIIDKLVGTDTVDGAPVRKFRTEYLKLNEKKSLEDLSTTIYGERRFWPLVAAINMNKLSHWPVTGNYIIPTGTLIEIWRVSRYFGKMTRTILSIASPDIQAGYKEILQIAQSGKQFGKDISFEQLSDYFKTKELGLQYSPAVIPVNMANLGELAIRYYGDKQFWPIISWVNSGKFGDINGPSTNIASNTDLYIITLLP